MTDATQAVAPVEGWHALHLFYKIEYGQWSMSSADEQLRAKTNLAALVQEIRATAETQLLTLAIVSPKADLGFLLLTPDLHQANAFEKRLSQVLGPDVLTAVYSYFSVTEVNEYAPGDEDLFPSLPGWPVLCFYPTTWRRTAGHNWYALPGAERQRLMEERSLTVQAWQGSIRQLVTASTGLDDAEGAVTLFAQSSFDIKRAVTAMRFDPLGAEYAEFGEFYLGLQLPLDELFRRVQL